MTRSDDRFTPKLGRIRARRGGRVLSDVNRVLALVARIEPRRFGKNSMNAGFTGMRIGRGAGHGHAAAFRRSFARFRTRRVVIKVHIHRLAGTGKAAARQHLRYIQREGVGQDGAPGRLYDALSDEADGKAFQERSDGDRHQFRIMVSAEDGLQLDDLKPFVRRFMRQMEADLETRLDWIAVDHFNTDDPHTHIVLRGRDERGRDLVIARDYIAHGMRGRASEILTQELGPRTDREIERAMRADVAQERFTQLDRELLAEADGDVPIDTRGTAPRDPYGRFRQALRLQRLQQLRRMGLAREERTGVWRLSPRLEQTLRRMGERGDIIRTMQRALTEAGRAAADPDLAIFDPADRWAAPVTGRIVAVGLTDELRHRHHLILEGADGRTHYVEIGGSEVASDLTPGAIVRVAPKPPEPRPADRIIAAVAGANGGRYDDVAHSRHDPTASDEFRAAHVRRLEALRRANIVAHRPDGSWAIPEDFLERAAAHEARQAARAPVRLQLLSAFALEQQVAADGATWLDRQLVGVERQDLPETGFGRAAREALERRRLRLIEEGLAEEREGRTIYRTNLLAVLRARELRRIGAALAEELGLPFVPARDGERIEGVYRRPVMAASGKLALIERSREFTLVPWRDVLERNRGKPVSGLVRGDGVSWTLGRQRSGPSIS